jgi:hypothetical protein
MAGSLMVECASISKGRSGDTSNLGCAPAIQKLGFRIVNAHSARA